MNKSTKVLGFTAVLVTVVSGFVAAMALADADNAETDVKFSSTIIVPDDYPTIQQAVDNARDGDTIFARNGTYPENPRIASPASWTQTSQSDFESGTLEKLDTASSTGVKLVKNSVYGNGSDGDVTISSNTTLRRDMNYRNLTVNAGVTLNTAGHIVRVSGTLTNNGVITDSVSGGAGGRGGEGGEGGPYGPSYIGNGLPGSIGHTGHAGAVEGAGHGGAGGGGGGGGAGQRVIEADGRHTAFGGDGEKEVGVVMAAV